MLRVGVSVETRNRSEDAVDELHAGLDSGRPDEKCRAALRLAGAGTLESLCRLEARTGDPSIAVEYTVRAALEMLRARLRPDAKLDTAELHPRLDSPYVEERLQTIVHLDLLRRPGSLPSLVAAWQAESDTPVLALLVRAILAHRDATHREIGMKALAHADPDVRCGALEGFWGWADPAVDGMVLPLRDDANPRLAAASDVFVIRRKSRQSEQHASALLACSDIWRRVVAIFALGGVHEPWARTLIAGVIKDETLALSVRTLARLVAVLQTRQLREPAVAKSSSEDPTIRTDLTRELPPIPDVVSLRAAMQSREPLLRLHALQNAERFSAADSIQILERLVRWETDALVVATLVKAVTRVGGAAQAHLILRFLEHADSRVRANTLEALADADELVDAAPLCKARLVEDESPRVRTLAASYLFRKSPQQAVEYFRRVVLGADAGARESALLILTTVRDERVLQVFREALRDPRRDVYQRAYQVLDAVSHGWEPAAALRRDFLEGRVAGEVIEGEPVSALIEAVESSVLSDRIHAIQRLARASDSRVDVVLELNLVARNAALRREAWAALNIRHTHVTLPNLLDRLGRALRELTDAGHAPVPLALRRRIQEATQDVNPAGCPDRETQQRIGRILYEGFENDEPMDGDLRNICLEIQAATAHIGASGTAAGFASAGDPARANHGRAAQLIAQIDGAESVSEPIADAQTGEHRGRMGAPLVLSLVFIGVPVLAAFHLHQTGDSGRALGPDAGRAEQSGEEAQLTLNRMARERDPARFADRFGGQALEFRAAFDRVGEDLVTAYLWSGSVLFSVHPGLTTHRLPRNLERHMACLVTGHVRDRGPDGVVAIIGSIKPVGP